MKENRTYFQPGSFFVGANYWTSHAGTHMWRDFDADVVRADLDRLAKHHIKVLRVFPNWADFQPIHMLRAGGNVPREIRMGEEPLPQTPAGQAGVDPVMMERFRIFADLAAERGIMLIVGLITGWMSGRMHTPEIFNERNLLTDPMVIKWQIKFVKFFVRTFKTHPAVLAWDLGNECNCLSPLESADQAYLWASAITNAIDAEDGDHPVISGLHGNAPEGVWRMQDLGEILDVLCTHPYPRFTPYCDTDPINRMKSALHAAAEGRYYGDIGNAPCFCEEIGTLGPFYGDENVAADYIRSVLFTLLAHDGRGLMWWCANEQLHLTHPPYDWNSVERELGLFHLDHSPKPVVEVIGGFQKFLEEQQLLPVPSVIDDAVCILSHEQDAWQAAYGAFLLAKQAGVNLRYAWCDGEIPKADAYLLPGICGDASLYGHVWEDVLRRVREDGATLYISIDDGLLTQPEAFTGVSPISRQSTVKPCRVQFAGAEFSLTGKYLLHTRATRAKVLAQSDAGDPVFTQCAYGSGQVFLMQYPIEATMAAQPGVADGPDAVPLYRFYRAMNLRKDTHVADCLQPTIGLTEHVQDENHRLLILVNYEPEDQQAQIQLKAGWQAERVLGLAGEMTARADAQGFTIALEHNNGAFVFVKKEEA